MFIHSSVLVDTLIMKLLLEPLLFGGPDEGVEPYIAFTSTRLSNH